MNQGARIALIIAALILAALVNGGVYTVTSGAASNPTGGTVYIVNKFTGSARVCTALYCRKLLETESVPPTGQ